MLKIQFFFFRFQVTFPLRKSRSSLTDNPRYLNDTTTSYPKRKASYYSAPTTVNKYDRRERSLRALRKLLNRRFADDVDDYDSRPYEYDY